MHTEKILIPLLDDEIAPRFDQATDVLLVRVEKQEQVPMSWETRVVVLAHASPEEICKLVMVENIKTVICAGIEEEYFQFLSWKGVRVIDNVIGSARVVAQAFVKSEVKPGDNFYN